MRSKLSAITVVFTLVMQSAVLVRAQVPPAAPAPSSYPLWEFGTMPRPAFKQVLLGVPVVRKEIRLTDAQIKAMEETSQRQSEKTRRLRREIADRQKFMAAREAMMKEAQEAIL